MSSKRRLASAVLLLLIAALFLTVPAVRTASAVSYGPDVTTTTGATSCGINGGSAASNAFDNNNGNVAIVSQAAGSTQGQACLGQDFGSGVTYHIRQMTIQQNASTDWINSVKIQNSSDGTNWNTVMTLTINTDANVDTYAIDSSAAYRYWRILANANPTTNNWRLKEVEMMEAIDWPTNTPSPSATPTITQTPTITPTPSNTPTPTPNYLIEVTSTLGAPMKLERSATFGDVTQFGISVAILLVLLIGFVYTFWRTRPNA